MKSNAYLPHPVLWFFKNSTKKAEMIDTMNMLLKLSQPTFTYSKSLIETPEKGVNYDQG